MLKTRPFYVLGLYRIEINKYENFVFLVKSNNHIKLMRLAESGYDIKIREIDLEELFSLTVRKSSLINKTLVEHFQGNTMSLSLDLLVIQLKWYFRSSQ